MVRFFDGNRSHLGRGAGDATIDIYSKERAVFGKQISSYAYRDDALNLVGSILMLKNCVHLGPLNTNKTEITGTWRDAISSAAPRTIR